MTMWQVVTFRLHSTSMTSLLQTWSTSYSGYDNVRWIPSFATTLISSRAQSCTSTSIGSFERAHSTIGSLSGRTGSALSVRLGLGTSSLLLSSYGESAGCSMITRANPLAIQTSSDKTFGCDRQQRNRHKIKRMHLHKKQVGVDHAYDCERSISLTNQYRNRSTGWTGYLCELLMAASLSGSRRPEAR